MLGSEEGLYSRELLRLMIVMNKSAILGSYCIVHSNTIKFTVDFGNILFFIC
jgi:hypothetical protein